MTDLSTDANQSTSGAAVQAAGDTAGVAADQSRNVASSASEQAKAVASQATSQARTVTDEARQQASRVVGDASTEFRTQMEQRLHQLVQSTRGASDQLRALHEGRTDEAGRAGDLARQASDKLGSLAQQADDLGLDGVTQEIARFARRRPGAFLAAALAGGVAAGRLMRSMKDTSGQSSSSDTTSRSLPSGTGRPYGVDAPPLTTGAALGGPPGHGLTDDTGLGIGEPDVGAPPIGGPAIVSPAVGEPNGPAAGGVI